MRITSIKHLTFHRNGISGAPFYSALIQVSEAGSPDVSKKTFLITFDVERGEGEGKIEAVVPQSCRVVDIAEPETNWRGDEFSYALSYYLKDNKVRDIYDLTTNEARNKKNEAKNVKEVSDEG